MDIKTLHLKNKIKKLAIKVGKPLLYPVMLMYYAYHRKDTPKWAKKIIFGALVYLVVPVDAMPDIIPVVGFSDDLSVILASLGAVAFYIDDEVRIKAKDKISTWLGDLSDADMLQAEETINTHKDK